MGSSEKDTNSDTSTEQAIVSANGLNHWPAIPLMKAIGMNTETMENVVAATARPISSVPSRAAVKWSFPISMCLTMFSRTTMASSIRIPIASESPIRDIVLRVKPNTSTAMNDARTETGSARPVITVERHELRKRKTTSTVSSAPRNSASSTFATEASTRSPEFFTTSIRTPVGSVRDSSSRRATTRSATSVVL